MLSEGKERQETTKTTWKNLTGGSFTQFIEAQRSDATKRNYAYSILKFMEYLNIGSDNVDSLLKDQDYTKKIQDQIIDYILYLKAKFLRYSTIAGYIAAVLSFYELNDITLNTKRICRYLGEAPLPLENRAYSKEEIAKILEFCDERSRAIILLLASGGCRINAVPFLKLKDLTVLPKYNLYEVMIYSDSNQKYYSFTTPTPTEQDVLTEYLKAVDNLTINEENRLKIKVEELTAKTETNEYIINHGLKEKEVEVQNLKEQLKSLPKQIEEENLRTIQKMLANFKEELRDSNNNPTAAS
jgi:hypothetical protein